jgi:hypothetical protein
VGIIERGFSSQDRIRELCIAEGRKKKEEKRSSNSNGFSD